MNKLTFSNGLGRAAAIAIIAVMLSGSTQCSIGGRDFGSGSSDTAQTTIAPIGTFGSVFAAGTEFATTSATVTLDGVAVGATALRPGQVATIKGSIDSGSGTATGVAVTDKLIGAVSATDPGSGSFTVLGQTVFVTPDTSVGPGFTVPDVAGFTVGTVLVIDGYRTSTGVIASRIDPDEAGQSLRVAGRVANLDGFALSFTLNGTTIDYSAVSGGLPNTITNGTYAVASGGTATAAATLRPAAVTALTESPPGASGDAGVVHGAITRVGSQTDFDVAGQTVAAAGTTTVTNGSLADVALDAEVEVTGTYTSAGTLTASQVAFMPSVTFRMVGPVHSINASASTLEIAGITLTVNARTRWDDQSGAGLKVFSLANLNVGDWVEVRGLPGGSLAATARTVVRGVQPTPAYLELQDVPSALSNPDLTLTGVSVDTSSASFTDAAGAALSRTSFFAAASGRVVRVKGSIIGNALVAATVAFRP